jgi:hypothetical protein
MNAQDTRKRSIDWLMRLAQVASITVALIAASDMTRPCGLDSAARRRKRPMIGGPSRHRDR